MNARTERAILEKLRELPPERLAEVEEFVDHLRSREQERSKSADGSAPHDDDQTTMDAFGMWAGRDDMAEVQAYLRKLRAPRHPNP